MKYKEVLKRDPFLGSQAEHLEDLFALSTTKINTKDINKSYYRSMTEIRHLAGNYSKAVSELRLCCASSDYMKIIYTLTMLHLDLGVYNQYNDQRTYLMLTKSLDGDFECLNQLLPEDSVITMHLTGTTSSPSYEYLYLLKDHFKGIYDDPSLTSASILKYILREAKENGILGLFRKPQKKLTSGRGNLSREESTRRSVLFDIYRNFGRALSDAIGEETLEALLPSYEIPNIASIEFFPEELKKSWFWLQSTLRMPLEKKRAYIEMELQEINHPWLTSIDSFLTSALFDLFIGRAEKLLFFIQNNHIIDSCRDPAEKARKLKMMEDLESYYELLKKAKDVYTNEAPDTNKIKLKNDIERYIINIMAIASYFTNDDFFKIYNRKPYYLDPNLLDRDRAKQMSKRYYQNDYSKPRGIEQTDIAQPLFPNLTPLNLEIKNSYQDTQNILNDIQSEQQPRTDQRNIIRSTSENLLSLWEDIINNAYEYTFDVHLGDPTLELRAAPQ